MTLMKEFPSAVEPLNKDLQTAFFVAMFYLKNIAHMEIPTGGFNSKTKTNLLSIHDIILLWLNLINLVTNPC